MARAKYLLAELVVTRTHQPRLSTLAWSVKKISFPTYVFRGNSYERDEPRVRLSRTDGCVNSAKSQPRRLR